jgi:hypothetical protein
LASVEDVKRRIEACAPKDAQQLLLAAADTPKNGPWRPIRQATRHLIEAADGFDPKPMNPDVWIGSIGPYRALATPAECPLHL